MDLNKTGVILYLKEANVVEGATGYSGDVTLDAHVDDLDMWHAIEKQLSEGLHLHRGKDFKSQLIEVLQDQQVELKDRLERERLAAVEENQLLKRDLGIARDKLLKSEREIETLKETNRLLMGGG
jgi:hypothetical protein